MSRKCGTFVKDQRGIDWFGRKPEGKRSLGSRRRGQEDNIKMVLQDVGCGLELISRVSGKRQVMVWCNNTVSTKRGEILK
jgi:hypothetical protein